MNHQLATAIITQAAQAAGLAEGRVMSLSAADNLTLPRPRLELQFLGESYARSGRKLAVTRQGGQQSTKRELYEVTLPVAANALAEDEAWLLDFGREFLKALPPGQNDEQGNFVRIRAQEATFSTPPAKRVGTSEIKVFSKVSKLFRIVFTWRLCKDEEQKLIETVTFNDPAWKG